MKVLITGASSGIGKSLALEFAKQGYDLVLVARSKDALEEVKIEIGSLVQVEICVLDLTILENCKLLHNQYSDIDILVNNAGFGLFGEFSTTSLEKELQMIDLNIKALHVLMKLYLEDMVKRDQGQILNVASIAGFMPGPMMSTYYATKNYVVSLSTGVREELRKRKSHVEIIILCPGPVLTNFNHVANVKFNVPSIDAEKAAKIAVEGMFKNKKIIIPSNMKLNYALVKISPVSLVLAVNSNMQERVDE